MTHATTVEFLEARARIADVVYRYAHIVRTGKVDACLELFTADATFEVREVTVGDPSSLRTRSKVAGHEAIFEYVSQSVASASVCPLIHNLLIDVNGREATSTAVMTAVMVASGQTMIGEYQDAFRNDHAWRFSGRVYTIVRGKG